MRPRIEVVVLAPGQTPEVKTIPNTLEGLQGCLNGGYLEAYYPAELASLGLHIYCDEEGLLKGLTPNCFLGGQLIHGPVILTKVDQEGEQVSLTIKEIKAGSKVLSESVI
jgi:hypothetical protein